MENVVVAWDDNAFADRIREETGSEVSVVTSKNSLDDWKEGRGLDDTTLVILLELTWQESHRSDFYGLEVVRDLLVKEEFDQPIVFCSFADRETLHDVSGASGELAAMPFPFERLPAPPSQLVERAKEAEPQSEIWLAFVRRIALQKPLLVRAHEIEQAAVKSNDEDMRGAAQDALNELDNLNLHLPDRLSEKRERAEDALNEKKYTEAREHLEEFAVLLRQIDTGDERTMRESASEQAKENIILVEDQEDQLNYYREGLRGDFNVWATQHAHEALEELKTNSGDYQAIVADWILFEPDDEGRRWQDLQGFELLEEVGKLDGTMCRVALTSSSRSVLSSIQNASSYTLYDAYFPKQEVGHTKENSFPSVANKIKEVVIKKERVKNRIPDKGDWSLEDSGIYGEIFLKVRFSKRWSEVREELWEDSRKIANDYKKMEGRGVDYREMDDIRYNYDINYKDYDGEERVIKIIKMRLVALYLYFGVVSNKVAVSKMLFGLGRESGYQDQIYSDLGIHYKEESFKKEKILPHEESWLNEMIDGRWLYIEEHEMVNDIKEKIDESGNIDGVESRRSPLGVIKFLREEFDKARNEIEKREIKEIFKHIEVCVGDRKDISDRAKSEFYEFVDKDLEDDSLGTFESNK